MLEQIFESERERVEGIEALLKSSFKLHDESRRVLGSVLLSLKTYDPELSSELATKVQEQIEEICDARRCYIKTR